MLADINLAPHEVAKVEALLERAKANSRQAQQMAVDASRLLTRTEQSAEEIANTGFFKRLWHANTGKHAQIMRANQADLIQMQRIAFGYLAALQDQNMVLAHATAVIRQNLDTLSVLIDETIDNTWRLTEAFKHRVGKVEDVVECHDWLLQLPRGDYGKFKPATRAILLAFDYVSRLHREGISFDRIEARQDVALALSHIDRDFNPKARYNVGYLFTEVVVDEAISAKDLSERMAQLEGVSGHLVAERVPSLSAQAVYRFESLYPQLEAALGVVEARPGVDVTDAMLCRGIPGRNEIYTLPEFVTELVAALFFAVDVAAPASIESVVVMQEPVVEPVRIEVVGASPAFDIDDIISGLIPVTRHAYLGTNPAQEERKFYLESFAVILASSGDFTTEQRNYLTSLGDAFGEPDVEKHIDAWLVDVRKMPFKEVLSFVKQEHVLNAWMTDAVFIWSLGDRSNGAAKDTISVMAKAMSLPVDFITDFLRRAEALSTETDAADIVRAIGGMTPYGDTWRTVMDYRKVSLRGAFTRERDGLTEGWSGMSAASVEISKLQLNIMGLDPTGDENVFMRGAMNMTRRMAVSDFNTLSEKVRVSGGEAVFGAYAAKSVAAMFGTPWEEDMPTLYGVYADDNVDLDNRNWLSNMDAALEKLRDYLNAVERMQGVLGTKLKVIENGEW